jgi:hypothetical protein
VGISPLDQQIEGSRRPAAGNWEEKPPNLNNGCLGEASLPDGFEKNRLNGSPEPQNEETLRLYGEAFHLSGNPIHLFRDTLHLFRDTVDLFRVALHFFGYTLHLPGA